ncbi:hypothetical protein ERJ75_001229400 [Trypanosoma vivax]|nr:hypothetical protein ERJ75_001229400 [Trypanosoma vivax]
MANWRVRNDLLIANAGSTTRRQPGTTALSSLGVAFCRDCAISDWKTAQGTDSDHYWITFCAFVGTSLDAIAPSKHARALYAWSKARWQELEN